jgi:hypothetical protein
VLDVRELEIDKAWQQHHPDRAKIPINVWRQPRFYKRGIATDAGRIAKACDDAKSIRELLDDFTRKGQVGRNRALQKIKHRLSPCRVEAVDKSAVIACWPEPRDSAFENSAPNSAKIASSSTSRWHCSTGEKMPSPSNPGAGSPGPCVGKML